MSGPTGPYSYISDEPRYDSETGELFPTSPPPSYPSSLDEDFLSRALYPELQPDAETPPHRIVQVFDDWQRRDPGTPNSGWKHAGTQYVMPVIPRYEDPYSLWRYNPGIKRPPPSVMSPNARSMTSGSETNPDEKNPVSSCSDSKVPLDVPETSQQGAQRSRENKAVVGYVRKKKTGPSRIEASYRKYKRLRRELRWQLQRKRTKSVARRRRHPRLHPRTMRALGFNRKHIVEEPGQGPTAQDLVCPSELEVRTTSKKARLDYERTVLHFRETEAMRKEREAAEKVDGSCPARFVEREDKAIIKPGSEEVSPPQRGRTSKAMRSYLSPVVWENRGVEQKREVRKGNSNTPVRLRASNEAKNAIVDISVEMKSSAATPERRNVVDASLMPRIDECHEQQVPPTSMEATTPAEGERCVYSLRSRAVPRTVPMGGRARDSSTERRQSRTKRTRISEDEEDNAPPKEELQQTAKKPHHDEEG